MARLVVTASMSPGLSHAVFSAQYAHSSMAIASTRVSLKAGPCHSLTSRTHPAAAPVRAISTPDPMGRHQSIHGNAAHTMHRPATLQCDSLARLRTVDGLLLYSGILQVLPLLPDSIFF